MLDITGLTLGYDGVTVVRGVTLTVAPGEAVCLVGPNGAGKTTTLRGISGTIPASAGSVRWDGVELCGAPAHRRASLGIALVPEGRHVFPSLTTWENLEVARRAVRRHGEGRAAIDHALDRFPRLRERMTQPAGLLSGGEQQMLAIARALTQEPRLLVIDEMSMGLAPVVCEQVAQIVRQLIEDGMSVLMVEQNAELALSLCSRGYLISGGEIVLEDDASALRENGSVRSLYLGSDGDK
jgi:branched-chain amino acid transport system ATP-binding protein